jgi:hypothetical protein
VLILLLSATAMSTLTLLVMGTDYGPVLMFPAAALAITTGSFAAHRARVAQGRAFLAGRVVLTLIIWLGLVARVIADMGLPFGGGHSAADVGVLFLGGTWAWAGLGTGVFGVKRLYEREAVVARLARRRGSQPSARWLVRVLTAGAAAGILVRLYNVEVEPDLLAAGALFAMSGALLVQRGFPPGIRSRLGSCLFLLGVFALCASVARVTGMLVHPLLSLGSSGPRGPKPELVARLGFAASYAVFGAWLLLGRPFADHEWRLRLATARGSR